MDLSTRDVNEDTKYAFLLGSALRNEDPEQTLAVYDNLIPEDISASRVRFSFGHDSLLHRFC